MSSWGAVEGSEALPKFLTTAQQKDVYDSIQGAKHVWWPKWVKIEVLLYGVPYIIFYAKFSGESISGRINAKS